MAQMTSGKVLREARERKGYDLATVARRLRIRPDILRAIEAGDFSAMPPRGYTRNMVNAYARLLGLNPTEIVNMYLDEAYADQVQRARGKAPSSGFNMEREPRRSRSRNRSQRDTDIGDIDARTGRRQVTYENRSYLTRDLYDDRTQFSRDDYGITRERTGRSDRSERDFLSHHSGYSENGYSHFEDRTPRRGRRDIHVGQTPMQFSASRLPGFLQSRVALIGVIAIVVVIIAIILFVVFGHKDVPQQDDVSQLPVSGIKDTTGEADGEASEEAAPVEIAPTSAKVVYSVKSGDDCYIETYTNDGDAVPEMLSGPVEKNLEVTGTWTITTYSPDTISVTVDGSPVTLQIDENYQSMYAYTVDFPKILDDWRSTHNSKSERRSAAVATANSDAETAEKEKQAQESAEAAAAAEAEAQAAADAASA